MNTVVKYIIVAVSSATAGATASFFITKKILTDKYEAEANQRIEEEIQNFKLDYKKKHETKSIPVSQLTDEQRARLNKKEENTMKIEDLKSLSDIDQEDEIPDNMDEDGNYYDDEGNPIADPAEDDEFNDLQDDEINENQYVISQEEFDNDEKYTKRRLSYYENDDTLADEYDEKMSIFDTIGDNAISHFGDMSGDPTIVYVRNESLNSDYEVQLVHGSYKKFVKDNEYAQGKNSPEKIRKFKNLRSEDDEE